MDEAIARSLTFEQFVMRLRDMGYEVKLGVKHMAVRPPERNVSRACGGWAKNNTEEAVKQRILKNDPLLLTQANPALCHSAQSRQLERGR